MNSVTSNAVAKHVILKEYTITTSITLQGKEYSEYRINSNDIPVAITGYKIAATSCQQTENGKDAFLFNLHIYNNKWSCTVSNTAVVQQTISGIKVRVLFIKDTAS